MAEVTIDDSSDLIQYSFSEEFGNWHHDTGLGGGVLNGTLSQVFSNQAYFRLNFTGTQISVYGTVAAAKDRKDSRYIIDGGPPTTFFAPNVTTDLQQQRLYQSPVLNPGFHTLLVMATSGESAYSLDYITYTPSPTHKKTSLVLGISLGVSITVMCVLVVTAFVLYRRRFAGFKKIGDVNEQSRSRIRLRSVSPTTRSPTAIEPFSLLRTSHTEPEGALVATQLEKPSVLPRALLSFTQRTSGRGPSLPVSPAQDLPPPSLPPPSYYSTK